MYHNIVWNLADKNTYLNTVADIAQPSSDMIKDALNNPNLSASDRVIGIWAGIVGCLSAPIGALFDPKNSWAYTAVAGQLMNDTMTLIRPTIIESAKHLWFSDKTAENIDILAETLFPVKVLKYKIKWLDEIAAHREAINGIKNEITSLYWQPKDLVDAYVWAKKEQYGTMTYAKWVEQFDAPLETARQAWDIESINNISNQIKEYNQKAYSEFKSNIVANSVLKVEDFTDKFWLKTKLDFVDSSWNKIPYLDLSQVSFWKWSDKMVKEEVTKNAFSDLSKFWSDKWLWSLKKDEVFASVDQYMKDTWLNQIQKWALKTNLFNELKTRKIMEEDSINSLYDISKTKDYATTLYQSAKENKKNGTISEENFKRIKSEYESTLDNIDEHKKYDEIKYQEAIGNITEWEVDENGMRQYLFTEKWLKYLPVEKRTSAIGYHFPEKLKQEIDLNADAKQIGDIVEKRNKSYENQILEDNGFIQSQTELPVENTSVDITGPNKTPKVDLRSNLQKSFEKSGITYEGFISKEIDRVLAKKEELAQMKTEIDASMPWKRVKVEWTGNEGNWIASESTFPKWIPSKLRDSKLMEKVYNRLEIGDFNIPEKNVKERQLMAVYLKKLWSNLSDMYDVSFPTKSENPHVEKARKNNQRNIQTKQMMNMFYNEYKKKQTEFKNLLESSEKIKENLKKRKQLQIDRIELEAQVEKEKLQEKNAWLKQKLEDKGKSNRDRRQAVRTFQTAYELSDKAFKEIVWDKDYFSFKTDYEFNQWLHEKEKLADSYLEKKQAETQLQATIALNELKNVRNLVKAYSLPNDMSTWTIDQTKTFDKILQDFKKWDNFLSTWLIKRFEIVWEWEVGTTHQNKDAIVWEIDDIDYQIRELKDYLSTAEGEYHRKNIDTEIAKLESKKKDLERYKGSGEGIQTVWEAKNAIARSIPELYDLPVGDLEASLYEARIQELKNQLSTVEESATRIEIEKELTQLEDAKKQLALEKNISDANLEPNSQKTTNQKVTEKKVIQGHWYDFISYDKALADRNPLYKFMVNFYNENVMKTKAPIDKIRTDLSRLLRDSRKSRSWKERGIKDILIPTDDRVFNYLSADGVDKIELAKDMTPEELNLAHYVADLMANFREQLTNRKVMENFKQNYITNLQKDWKEVLKTEWMVEVAKNIFKKQERQVDFWAAWPGSEAIWYEKFFKFSIERTWEMNPSKDIGKAVMAYTKTFYKKVALDETIPKVVLFKNILADSLADKVIVQWLNNKKGITVMPYFQWTFPDKIIKWLMWFVSMLDMGLSPVTGLASAWWVMLSNYIELGIPTWKEWLKRKLTSQGRMILKKYSAEIWQNPLWDAYNQILIAPDVPPLEKAWQLAFVMLSQTLQSWMNTAFLAKITKEEFLSGEVSHKRIAEIFVDMGATHAMPWTNSIVGSTSLGKFFMMYKSWAVPLLYTNAKNALTIVKSTPEMWKNPKWALWVVGKNKEAYLQLNRWLVVPTLMLIAWYKLMTANGEENNYWINRILQELTSSIGAMDLNQWLWEPRAMKFMLDVYLMLQWVAKQDRYKQTKEWSYTEWDLKAWNQMKTLFTPWVIKSVGKVFAVDKKTWWSSSSSVWWDLSNFDMSSIDMSWLSAGGAGDLSNFDMSSIDMSWLSAGGAGDLSNFDMSLIGQ
jgi:hypothetical protein